MVKILSAIGITLLLYSCVSNSDHQEVVDEATDLRWKVDSLQKEYAQLDSVKNEWQAVAGASQKILIDSSKALIDSNRYRDAINTLELVKSRGNNNWQVRKLYAKAINEDSSAYFCRLGERTGPDHKAAEYYKEAYRFIKSDETLFLQAKRLSKDYKKEAVAILKKIKHRHDGALLLHEEINPLKTRQGRFLYSLCRDGSHSSSTGRGTCSHHGGVSRTVYEQIKYREY